MTKGDLESMAGRFLAAWNDQDVERVVGIYTEDLVYRDPNTRGEVRGREAFRRYLSRLFAAWTMRWSLREARPLVDGKGFAVLWRATLAPAGSRRSVDVDGMDLVELEGDRISRNEVYFDRAALTPALGVWRKLRLFLGPRRRQEQYR